MMFVLSISAEICSCHHELETARINGLLGNIDANTGDPQVGMCAFFHSINFVTLNIKTGTITCHMNECCNVKLLSLLQAGTLISFW